MRPAARLPYLTIHIPFRLLSWAMSLQELTHLQDRDLKLLLLIRHFELLLLRLFSEGKLNGTIHTCLGQEYIPVALKPTFSEHDFIFSNHRGHGHYLARFEDPAGLLAEIMGRQGAICNGVGGSQHVYRDKYLSTGIQGESLPVAVGVALHLKRSQKNGLAVVHIGDGTWGQGAVYEALNMAQLWRLPLLVLVENNRIAQSTPVELQMAGTIEGRVRGFGIDYLRISSCDINGIRVQVAPRIKHTRKDHWPLVIEFDTYRLGPHSKGDDTRPPEQIRKMRTRDWYPIYQKTFPQQFERIEAKIQTEVMKLRRDVESRPLATWANVQQSLKESSRI
jgi:TPP-dependent pyruvate/acetoin dehydrogenase alpha subunit